jgi:hypothetical protein
LAVSPAAANYRASGLVLWTQSGNQKSIAVEITERSTRGAPNYTLTPENAQHVACGGSLHSGNTFWKN